MNIVYAKEKLPNSTVGSIFLAGPTPRNNSVESWRPEALRQLEVLGYRGDVFVPEPRDGIYSADYVAQVEWELAALERADVIVFWVPREMTHMPALTTNVEFGLWIDSGKAILGFPATAEKMRYLEHHVKSRNDKVYTTLDDTLKAALNTVGKGSRRIGGECDVPLHIWRTDTFQLWYTDLKLAGNRLDGARVVWTFPTSSSKPPFFWALKVNVWINSESRSKDIEVVISRPHICAAVMYKSKENILDTEVVLVREFRSAVSNAEGYVWELPGGSDPLDSSASTKVVAKEIHEETGLVISEERLQMTGSRQQMSTLTSTKATLYKVELTDMEIKYARSLSGQIFGDAESTEQTYVEVVTLREVLQGNLVDWTNTGMLMQVILG